jgi:hypothetical protein
MMDIQLRADMWMRGEKMPEKPWIGEAAMFGRTTAEWEMREMLTGVEVSFGSQIPANIMGILKGQEVGGGVRLLIKTIATRRTMLGDGGMDGSRIGR